jgi:alpha-ketoglutarate-dependent taurine dioxygenase
MEVVELSPAIGVEVRGIDLREPLEREDLERLRALFDTRHLLHFARQLLSGDEQRRVVASFGQPLDESADHRGYTYVSNVRPDGVIREGSLLFHSDLAFTDHPLDGISLYAVEVPIDGAPTRWANAVRAAERLPAALRRIVEDRKAVHVFDLRDARGDRPFRIADLPPSAPRAEHPVLLTHPRTGATVLFVSEMQTDAIVGLEPRESEDVLCALRALLYAPDNVYEHRWHPGDLVMWDNLALQHGRGDIPVVEPRTLRRVPLGSRGVTLQRADA